MSDGVTPEERVEQDTRFCASQSGTIHERAEWDGDREGYRDVPVCGQRLPVNAEWSIVDVDSVGEAVIEHDLNPCGKCFSRPLWSSVDRETVKGARREMDYQDVEGSLGMTHSTSFPAQLRFGDEFDVDVDRVLAAIEQAGLSVLDAESSIRHRAERGAIETEVCWRHNYERMKIRLSSSGQLRIYPRDYYIPGGKELADLLGALSWACGASLKHDPMDREGDDD